MRHLSISPIKLAILSSLAMFNGVTSACSCSPPLDPLPNASRADAVFVAKILAVRTSKRGRFDLSGKQAKASSDRPSADHAGNDIEVLYVMQEIFKGATRIENNLTTKEEIDACGYPHFEVGSAFLVYASRSENRSLVTNICTRTKKLVEATDEIQLLRSRYSPDISNNK